MPRISRAQDLSCRLKVNEFADLTNTKPWIEEVLSRDRLTPHTVSFEEECGSQTAKHHKTTTPPPTDVTTSATPLAKRKHASKNWRSDVPIILPGWGHHTGGPQSTPTVHPGGCWLGSSQFKHHSTTRTQQPSEPNTLHETTKSRIFECFFMFS